MSSGGVINVGGSAHAPDGGFITTIEQVSAAVVKALPAPEAAPGPEGQEFEPADPALQAIAEPEPDHSPEEDPENDDESLLDTGAAATEELADLIPANASPSYREAFKDYVRWRRSEGIARMEDVMPGVYGNRVFQSRINKQNSLLFSVDGHGSYSLKAVWRELDTELAQAASEATPTSVAKDLVARAAMVAGAQVGAWEDSDGVEATVLRRPDADPIGIQVDRAGAISLNGMPTSAPGLSAPTLGNLTQRIQDTFSQAGGTLQDAVTAAGLTEWLIGRTETAVDVLLRRGTGSTLAVAAGSPTEQSLDERHAKIDEALRALDDEQVHKLYARAGLAGERQSAEFKRKALWGEHPDDIEPVLAAFLSLSGQQPAAGADDSEQDRRRVISEVETTDAALVERLLEHPLAGSPSFDEVSKHLDFRDVRTALLGYPEILTPAERQAYQAVMSDYAEMELRITEEAPFDVPSHWLVLNAARPLLGDQTLENGPWLAGRFYAAIDPTSSMAQRYLKMNRDLAARAVIVLSKDEQLRLALADNEYRERYLERYEGKELYEAVEPIPKLITFSVGELRALRGRSLAALVSVESRPAALLVPDDGEVHIVSLEDSKRFGEAEIDAGLALVQRPALDDAPADWLVGPSNHPIMIRAARKLWSPAKWDHEVQAVFERREYTEAFELYHTGPDAVINSLEAFKRDRAARVGGPTVQNVLSAGQRAELFLSGLSVGAISGLAQYGIPSLGGEGERWASTQSEEVIRQFTESLDEVIPQHATLALQVDAEVQQYAIRFHIRSQTLGPLDHKDYSLTTSTAAFAEELVQFAARQVTQAERANAQQQQALEDTKGADAPGLVTPAAVPPDVSAEVPAGVDRQWRGFTANDLWAAHHDGFGNVGSRGAQISLENLIRAELEGITVLPMMQQRELLRFMGWGAAAQGLRVDHSKSSANTMGLSVARLLDMTAAEFNRHLLTHRLESYYTPAAIIKPMWEMVQQLGVPASAKVLDAGCGTAGFFIGAPSEFQQHARMVGVEVDPIAVRLAKVTCPDAKIVNLPYEQAVLDKNFDVVMGNVPFGETVITDSRYPNASHIHDYFIVRSLDQLAAGGVMAVITSSGTMDKVDSRVREQIMARANLVAAYRLPQDVFSQLGATVTTDILILQRRPDGTAPDVDFSESVPFVVDGQTFNVNRYWHDNRRHVIGAWEVRSSAFGPKLHVAATPSRHDLLHTQKLMEISTDLSELAKELPAQLVNRTQWRPQAKQNQIPGFDLEPRPADSEFLSDYQGFVGDWFILDGRLSEVLDIENTFDADGVLTGSRHVVVPLALKGKRNEEVVRAYIPLRDATRDLMAMQLRGSDAELAAVQEQVQSLYTAFSDRFGALNKAENQRAFAEDAGSAEVLALEVWNDLEDRLERTADALVRRVVLGEAAVSVASAEDAFYVVMDRSGKVDFAEMAALVGQPEDEVRQALLGTLVFINPESGQPEPAYQYLSGNVRKKLLIAEQAAELDEAWEGNVQALRVVQPAPISFADITIKIGANWVPEADIREFTLDLFDTKFIPVADFDVQYHRTLGSWVVDASNRFKSEHEAARKTLYGTELMGFEQLLEKLLNNQRPTHYHEVDGRKIVDDEATLNSRSKQDLIEERFQAWVACDGERAERYARLYNESTNVFVLPKIDGSHLTFPGMSSSWKPRSHQLNMVGTALLGYNCVAAHCVGAGKTFEMVAIAIKLKQLGMWTKPMIAVPNHMLGQIARETKQMFPGARVLMVSKDDLRGNARKRFLAIARSNDWDVVVCTHSMLNQIQAPLDTQRARFDVLTMQLEAAIDSTDNERSKRRLAAKLKTVQAKRSDLERRFETQEKKGPVLTIDQLGVDGLLVDELHNYKNLELATSMNLLGIPTAGSARAANLDGLAEYLRELHGKSFGLIGATGTIISNSMAEAFVHNKVFRPDLMEEVGIYSFDDWASRFGDVVTGLEALPEGGGFRVNERFAKFVNVPEMLKLFRSFVDVQTRENLQLPTPEVETLVESVEQSDLQKAFMAHLSIRAQAIRGSTGARVDPRDDNMLAIATAGRKAALDLRLVVPELPAEASLKLAAVADNVYAEYLQHAGVKGTQLVFMDLGTPGEGKPFSTYEALKELLADRGMPADEIAFIHDAKTDDEKEALFTQVRSGAKRVLLGSTEKMGVGTNVQERLCAIHHADCPWRPADIEQRKGRIERQGNLHFDKVKEYRYTTKDSFDLFMWETNQRKARFMNQALSEPDAAGREISEEMDLGYAAVMAVTTGNPMIREKVEVDDEVVKLERRYRAWLSDGAHKRMALRSLNKDVQDRQRFIQASQQVLEALPNATYQCVEVRGAIANLQDGSTTWLRSTEIGEALKARLVKAEVAMGRERSDSESLNAFVGGVELRYVRNSFKAEDEIRGYVNGEVMRGYTVTACKSPVNMGYQVTRMLFGAAGHIKEIRAELDRLRHQIKMIGPVAENAVWERQAELDDARARKRELDAWFMSQGEAGLPKDDPFPAMVAEYAMRHALAPHDGYERVDTDALDEVKPDQLDVLIDFEEAPPRDSESHYPDLRFPAVG